MCPCYGSGQIDPVFGCGGHSNLEVMKLPTRLMVESPVLAMDYVFSEAA